MGEAKRRADRRREERAPGVPPHIRQKLISFPPDVYAAMQDEVALWNQTHDIKIDIDMFVIGTLVASIEVERQRRAAAAEQAAKVAAVTKPVPANIADQVLAKHAAATA